MISSETRARLLVTPRVGRRISLQGLFIAAFADPPGDVGQAAIVRDTRGN